MTHTDQALYWLGILSFLRNFMGGKLLDNLIRINRSILNVSRRIKRLTQQWDWVHQKIRTSIQIVKQIHIYILISSPNCSLKNDYSFFVNYAFWRPAINHFELGVFTPEQTMFGNNPSMSLKERHKKLIKNKAYKLRSTKRLAVKSQVLNTRSQT